MKHGRYIDAMRGPHPRSAPRSHKPLSDVRKEQIRRRVRASCIIRELSALGLTCAMASRAIGRSEAYTSKIAKAFDVVFFVKNRQAESPLRAYIRQWYGIKSPTEIAAIFGTTPKTVGVIAFVIGRAGRIDPARFTRGFVVPDHRFDEYIAIRHELGNKMTARETAISMGLLPRPEVQAHG